MLTPLSSFGKIILSSSVSEKSNISPKIGPGKSMLLDTANFSAWVFFCAKLAVQDTDSAK